MHNPLTWIDPLGFAGCSTANTANQASSPYGPKNSQQMAEELANKINKNSIAFSTPSTVGNIDLRGRAHFDKMTQMDIPTPHVQTSKVNIAPDGRRFPLKKTEIATAATKQDIRIARKLAKLQGLL